MTHKLYFLIEALAIAIIVSSCTQDEPISDMSFPTPLAPLEIYADISGSARSRATITTESDQWSYTDFEANDAMGFFSSGGKYDPDGSTTTPFTNQKLIYDGTGTNFRDPDGIQFSPTHMKGNEILMYFPYFDDISSDSGHTLRMKPQYNKDYKGNDSDTLRCIDFLSSNELTLQGVVNNKKAALYGEFSHAFAELIIMRGEGFDKPVDKDGKSDWTIKVVLNQAVTGIKITPTIAPWDCTPKLVYDKNSMLDENSAMTWEAWLGDNYHRTADDTIGVTAWYVIVPTIGCQANIGKKKLGERTIVQYIELYDNDGNLQRVSSLKLSNSISKYVDAGWRYPMEITMKELVPTANPCTITPWQDNIDLTDELTRGINNETDFMRWVEYYNAYLADGTEAQTKALLQYGDLFIDPAGNKSWHFYVLNDLDLTNYKPSYPNAEGSSTPIIPQLNDILDGVSTTLVNGRFINHSIKGLTNTLVGELNSTSASIQNFDFISPNVKYENNDGAVGIIANKMENSSVVNCNIDNGTLINEKGFVGIIVGEISGGLVDGCVLSGSIVGKTAQGDGEKIAGKASTFSKFTNNSVDNIITLTE